MDFKNLPSEGKDSSFKPPYMPPPEWDMNFLVKTTFSRKYATENEIKVIILEDLTMRNYEIYINKIYNDGYVLVNKIKIDNPETIDGMVKMIVTYLDAEYRKSEERKKK